MYRFTYNESELEVREDQLWQLAVPTIGALVLTAAFIGPLIVGAVFTAVAVAAAISAGAIFTSLFLPFFIFIGFGALMFGGITFSMFATLGTALFLPKIIGLGVAAAGLGVAGLVLGGMMRPLAIKKRRDYAGEDSDEDEDDDRRRAKKGGKGKKKQVAAPDPIEAEVLEQSRQLRDFDTLLAEREEQRRLDRWRDQKLKQRQE